MEISVTGKKEVLIISGTDMLTALDIQIEQIGKVLSENPDDIGVLMAYGEFHFRRGRYLEALQAYQKVATVRQDIQDAHLALAKIYIRQSMIADAYSEIHKVFEILPHSIEGFIVYKKLEDIMEPPEEFKADLSRWEEHDLDPAELVLYKHQKELERERMDHEIKELGRIMDEHDEEPIHEYNYEMAVMRKKGIDELFCYIERLEDSFSRMAEEQGAMDIQDTGHGHEVPDTEQTALLSAEDRGESENLKTFDVMPDLLDVDEFQPERGEGDQAFLLMGGDDLDEPLIFMPGEPLDDNFEKDFPELALLDEELAPSAADEEPGISGDGAGEPEKAQVSEERLKFYSAIKESVITVMAGLVKTKGVTVVMTVAKDGIIIDSIINEAIDSEEISSIVRAGITTIGDWRPADQGKSFLYWVLEFEQGLLVIRAINNEHFLLAIGKAGANFGAMRYSMEKGKEALDEILSSAPSL